MKNKYAEATLQEEWIDYGMTEVHRLQFSDICTRAPDLDQTQLAQISSWQQLTFITKE